MDESAPLPAEPPSVTETSDLQPLDVVTEQTPGDDTIIPVAVKVIILVMIVINRIEFKGALVLFFWGREVNIVFLDVNAKHAVSKKNMNENLKYIPCFLFSCCQLQHAAETIYMYLLFPISNAYTL